LKKVSVVVDEWSATTAKEKSSVRKATWRTATQIVIRAQKA